MIQNKKYKKVVQNYYKITTKNWLRKYNDTSHQKMFSSESDAKHGKYWDLIVNPQTVASIVIF